MVGGSLDACASLIARIGKERAIRVEAELAVHCRSAKPFEAAWHDAHHQPARPAGGVRFYFNAVHEAVELGPDIVADLLTRQAMDCVDLRPTIILAWEDGVRKFVEIGPPSAMTTAIRSPLSER